MTKINAGFSRRVAGSHRRVFEWRNVGGMTFDVASFRDITASMIRAHPQSLPIAEGWHLQGWADATLSLAFVRVT